VRPDVVVRQPAKTNTLLVAVREFLKTLGIELQVTHLGSFSPSQFLIMTCAAPRLSEAERAPTRVVEREVDHRNGCAGERSCCRLGAVPSRGGLFA
jgi:hypothetical protein